MDAQSILHTQGIMSVFVTVGSTGFDELVDVVTTGSFLSALKSLGYSSVVIQYGSSEHVYTRNVNQLPNGGITTEGYAYKPSIEDDMKRASLIISHAGTYAGLGLMGVSMDYSNINRIRIDATSASFTQAIDCCQQYIIDG